MSAKSLLFTGDLPYSEPPGCGPGRQEAVVTLHKDGRFYRLVLRDKIAIEDPYLVMVRAAVFAVQQVEPYSGLTPERSVRDFLIKSTVVI